MYLKSALLSERPCVTPVSAAGPRVEHVGPVGLDGVAAARGGEGVVPSKNVTARSSTLACALARDLASVEIGVTFE